MVHGEQTFIEKINSIYSQQVFLMIESEAKHESITHTDCEKITFQIQLNYLQKLVSHGVITNLYCNTTTIKDVDKYNNFMELINVYLKLTDFIEYENIRIN